MTLDAKHIHCIAVHATAATAHPSIGNRGTNISQATWSSAGYETIGSKQLDDHDHDLDQEALDLVQATISTAIRAPRDQAPQDFRLEGGTLDDFDFTCFGVPEALVTLSSNMTIGSNAMQPSTSLTPRALAIELNGHGILFIPRAILKLSGIPMGTVGEDVAKAVFTVQVKTDSTLKAGWKYTWRQS